MQHFVNNSNCSILDFILHKVNSWHMSWGVTFLNDNNLKIAFEELIDIYSKKEHKPTMEEYDKARDYLEKAKYNVLKRLFKDDWKYYLVMILQKCIEPIKI